MKNKVLFLDRDGVINTESGYIWESKNFVFMPFLFDLLQKATHNNFKIVIVTNQGGIEKGLYSHQQVADLHNFMLLEFAKNDIKIEYIFYCPHHNNFSSCLCRKPNSLLFERAAALLDADLSQSWMLGDKNRDIIPTQKMGIRSILVGNSDEEKIADFYAEDLKVASEIIFGK